MRYNHDKLPYVSTASNLEGAISRLEGWSFGGNLRFGEFSGQLNISMNTGWVSIEGFRFLPGLKEFSDKLNSALTPIIREYAQQLRQELANECTRIAARSLINPSEDSNA